MRINPRRGTGTARAYALLLCIVFGWSPTTAIGGEACGDLGDVSVQVLGAGGPELTDQLGSSSYLVWLGGRARLLVDTGSGAALNFERAGAAFEDLDAIVYTHLHADHSAALPAFIKGGYFSSRDRDLFIFGPSGNELLPSTSDFVQRMFGTAGLYPYLKDVLPNTEHPGKYQLRTSDVTAPKGEVIAVAVTGDMALSATAAHHGPLPALAWRVDIDEVSIVFTGDTTNQNNAIERLGTDVDLLVVHNAIPEAAGGIATNLHMKPSEIAQLARITKPKQILLSHFMTRSVDTIQRTKSKISAEQASAKVHAAGELACYPLR